MRALLLVCAASVIACGPGPHIELDYKIAEAVALDQVVRVETTVRVAAPDMREFFADQPYRTVATGVGYEVRDFDGDGTRSLLITEDATLGYSFASTFRFTLLAPSANPPTLTFTARAVGPTATVAQSATVVGTFGDHAKVALALADTRCGAVTCGEDQLCCDGTCTNVQTDGMNCGACGTSCGGETCSGGLCRCVGGSACATGQTCCAVGGCTDVKSDTASCGACGKACAPGETCTDGACTCGTATCSAGELCCTDGSGAHCATSCSCGPDPSVTCDTQKPLCCGSTCFATDDDANCGQCGKACATGTTCTNGACLCNGTAKCTGSDTCCSTGCASLADDPSNCGQCGNVCAAGSTCSAGKCTCGTSGATCDVATSQCCGDSCVNVKTSSASCGGCNIACNPGETCSDGACMCPGTTQHCTGTTVCCPSAGCYDVSTDAKHCGHSCDVCASGNCGAGSCVPQCTTDAQCPNAYCCNGTCTSKNAANCSKCGDACSTGQGCCPIGNNAYQCKASILLQCIL